MVLMPDGPHAGLMADVEGERRDQTFQMDRRRIRESGVPVNGFDITITSQAGLS